MDQQGQEVDKKRVGQKKLESILNIIKKSPGISTVIFGAMLYLIISQIVSSSASRVESTAVETKTSRPKLTKLENAIDPRGSVM